MIVLWITSNKVYIFSALVDPVASWPDYFLPKNDMMLPWPPLPAGFLVLLPAEEDGVEEGVAFLEGGGASSSEKDSQPDV